MLSFDRSINKFHFHISGFFNGECHPVDRQVVPGFFIDGVDGKFIRNIAFYFQHQLLRFPIQILSIQLEQIFVVSKLFDFAHGDDGTFKNRIFIEFCFVGNGETAAVFAVKNEGAFQFFQTFYLVVYAGNIEFCHAIVRRKFMFEHHTANFIDGSEVFRRIERITADAVGLKSAVDTRHAVTVAVEQFGVVTSGAEGAGSISATARIDHQRRAVNRNNVSADIIMIVGFPVVGDFECRRKRRCRSLTYYEASGIGKGTVRLIVFNFARGIVDRIIRYQRKTLCVSQAGYRAAARCTAAVGHRAGNR